MEPGCFFDDSLFMRWWRKGFSRSEIQGLSGDAIRSGMWYFRSVEILALAVVLRILTWEVSKGRGGEQWRRCLLECVFNKRGV